MPRLPSPAVAVALAGALALAGCGRDHDAAQAPETPDTSRVVSAGGAVTELLVALGARDRLVGVDRTSIFPADLADLPRVGMFSELSAEGILTLSPTALIATAEAGPPPVLDQLERSGLRILRVSDPTSTAEAADRIRTLARWIGAPERGEQLATALTTAMTVVGQRAASFSPHLPRTLFVYARGARILLVGGRDTVADRAIALAGGANAAAAFEGFKPLTAEAVVAADPEWILVTTHGLESVGGVDGVLGLPGIALTTAGRERRVIAVDDLALLGFGPRMPAALGVIQDAWAAGRDGGGDGLGSGSGDGDGSGSGDGDGLGSGSGDGDGAEALGQRAR